MFGLKDLDIYLGDFLSDKDVINLSWTNSRCYQIYNKSFFKNRFCKKYKITVPEDFDKKEFCQVYDQLSHWSFAVTHDKDYLLNLFKINHDHALNLAIKNDSVKCFKTLSSFYTFYHETLSIQHNSSKIIKFSSDQKLLTFANHCIVEAISRNCFDYIIQTGEITEETIEYFFHNFSYHCDQYVEKWSQTYNPSLDLFISKIPKKIFDEQKRKLIERSHFHVIKLLIQYTSPFGSFNNCKINNI